MVVPVLRNAAEEETILRNNRTPAARAPIRLYCSGLPRKLAAYFGLLRPPDTMIVPAMSVIVPAGEILSTRKDARHFSIIFV